MAVEDHTVFYTVLRMMDDEQLFSFFHTLYTINVLQLIALATGSVALREYLAHLGAEYRTWKLLLQGRVMPARLAIILVRYAYLGAFLTAVYFMLGAPKPHDCNPLYRSVFGLYTVLWGAAGSIFLMRLNIIFARQRAVMTLFIVLWFGCIGLWVYVTTLLRAEPMPKITHYPYGPVCITGRFPKIGAIAWGGSILFDSVVFIATFIRFRNASKTKGQRTVQLRSRKWIFRSNLYYFGASFFFNAAMLFSSLYVNDPVLSNVGNSLAFAIHCCVATRLVFTTRGWATSGSVDDEDDVILNTFNKNRRQGGPNLGVASRITYTVDETIVTSAGDHLEDGNDRRDGRDDLEATHPQYSYSHRGSLRGSQDHDLPQRDGTMMKKATPPSSRRQTQAHLHSDYTPEIGSRQESMPKVSTSVRKKPVARSRRSRQSTDSLEEKRSTNDHQYTSSRHHTMESGDISRPANAFMGNSVSHSTHVATMHNQARIEAEIAQPSGDHNAAVENMTYTPTYAEQHARASSLFYDNNSTPNGSPSSESFDLRAQNSITPSHLMTRSTSSNAPPSPGTLSNPPSYSALDQHIRQTASSSSLRPPASPATYEIQQSDNRPRRPSRGDRRQR
ncbi:uncharacterized protein FA14DRAFT_183100 [Meira miltonrushii]|uniref:Uncharacterized protein n=1 Tax=Meira miltonrushii TaxID=1280837 RepID=A0A316VGJ9_9BASI|nr:uncharacterized protein FA14DRAFT_183100 [Meira miltonrushii]PWN36630.1 hypothetical protein FA14DRAFT_183100 [Meira miltonrushii]